MEMHQVRYFLAVAEALNFTKAAETCNVTQPSLTRAIKLLEGELGGQLFHRERANTHLSELGRTVKPHLEQVYETALAAKSLAQDLKRVQKTTLKLGIMCTIAPSQLIEFIDSVQGRHGGIEIELIDANGLTLQDRLFSGQLEAAIYCLPGTEPDPGLHVMPLFREQMMIVVPPGHPFAAKNAVVLTDLQGGRYLNRVNCEFVDYGGKVFAERGVECQTVYRTERDDWIFAMVRAGLGFGFMPQFSVTDPGVVARPLIDPEFWRTVNLVTVRGRPHSPAVGALVREAMRAKWIGETAIAVQEAKEQSGLDDEERTSVRSAAN
jgi:LysR family transcriptional regulator, hydrogen peroxide-inducible genes activator